jgi:REP element-mobilizing transposase RayT
MLPYLDQAIMDIKNRITGEVFFVKDTVVDWVDIFTRPIYRHIIIESLQYCQKEKGLIIYAWVIMTNHMYMIVGSKGENKVSDILRDFKKFTSKEIIRTLLVESTESRRDWMLNRFEYAGKNDKKIKNYRFWQEGNDAQEIFLNDYFNQKLNYIHDNPVKAEFVNRAENYKYSSAIDWVPMAIGRKGLLEVTLV